jgi:hypothetical protein
MTCKRCNGTKWTGGGWVDDYRTWPCSACQIPDPAEGLVEKLRGIIQELIDLAGPCDDAVDRRWCANHSQGDCDGEGIIARARLALEGGKPPAEKGKAAPSAGFAGAAQASMIHGCPCWACAKPTFIGGWPAPIFRVCPKCGNKRCPKCESHSYRCTGSNQPDQVGELEQPTAK